MPDLTFHIEGAEVLPLAVSPTLALKLRVTNALPGEHVHTILLRSQIQIEALRRRYSAAEQELLFDLFGPSQDWSRTLRSLLWTQASVSVPGFVGSTLVDLPVACTYDLNVAAAKYFHALAGDDVPLSLAFNGTVFYAGDAGPLQVAYVPWDKEAKFRLPVSLWKDLMDRYYPRSAWLYLDKDVFNRLYEYKCRGGFATWEQTLDSLLALTGEKVTP
jgi:hypothetical protein